MSDDTARLDLVAEAICRADNPRDDNWQADAYEWDIRAMLQSDDGDYYRSLAQAAIDSLQLAEEIKTLADGAGGLSTNYLTGVTTVHSKPCTKMGRFVSPWVVRP